MLCCGNCFGDAFIAKQVARSKEMGDCGYCDSRKVSLTEPAGLVDLFEALLGVYQVSNSSGARSAVEILRADWLLFDSLAESVAQSLLGEVFCDSDAASLTYVSGIDEDIDAIDQWEVFRAELKHENRYFPQNPIVTDRDRLGMLFDLLVSPDQFDLRRFFRARVCEGKAPFGIDQMGKPPALAASHGRANPVGIPYLYLASDRRTAVAEVRPSIGDQVCVASYDVNGPLTLADLRDPRKSISPFQLDDDAMRMLMRDRGYLCRLGEELSSPVLPREAELEYLPSQYLCEFIKHRGFDGVLYKSAVAKGYNMSVFSDEKLDGCEVQTVRVDRVEVGFQDV